jgi:hypothetical protein
MPDEVPWPADFDPREALAEAEGASGAMVKSTEAPGGFTLAVALIISTIMALATVAPWPVLLGVGALVIPLGVWYMLLMRERPKPRPILGHSGPYVLNVLLFMLVVQGGRFWEVRSWWEIAAKWVVVFVISWYAMTRMRTAAIRNRLKDANECPV